MYLHGIQNLLWYPVMSILMVLHSLSFPRISNFILFFFQVGVQAAVRQGSGVSWCQGHAFFYCVQHTTLQLWIPSELQGLHNRHIFDRTVVHNRVKKKQKNVSIMSGYRMFKIHQSSSISHCSMMKMSLLSRGPPPRGHCPATWPCVSTLKWRMSRSKVRVLAQNIDL